MGEEIYQKALEYAKKKHEGQFRIGGAPFIVHPIAVAEILRQDGKQVEYGRFPLDFLAPDAYNGWSGTNVRSIYFFQIGRASCRERV